MSLTIKVKIDDADLERLATLIARKLNAPRTSNPSRSPELGPASLADDNPLTGSDKHYGYRFGCDGLLSRVEVARILGRSTRTIDRMIAEGTLRRGKDGRAVSVCRRSIDEYLRSIQE